MLGLKLGVVLLGGRNNGIGKPFATAAAAGSAGYSSMTSFFKPVTKPNPGGRPRKLTRHRAAAEPPLQPTGLQPPKVAPTPLSAIEAAAAAAAAGVLLAPAEVAAVIAAAAALPKGKKKASRTDWSAGVPLQRMTQAIEDWKDKKGDHYKEGMTRKEFTIAARIPEKTFQKYAQGKRVLGMSMGRPGHLDDDECLFVVDLVRRRDRARDGLGPGEISSLVQELKPSLSAKQATNAASFLRKQNSDVLTKSTTAQATTTARVAVNIPGQYRWHEVPGMECISKFYTLGLTP